MRGNRACRVDANHGDIVAALKAIGCSVCDLSAVGGGCPDLLVGIGQPGEGKGGLVLIEVKDGSKPESRQKLTPEQAIFRSEWRGPLFVVNSVASAISVVNRMRSGRT